jgi:hypothetical protein
LTDTDRDKSFQQVLASFLRDNLAAAGPDCLAPGAAAAYYAGALSEAEARGVEAHLAGCGACQAEIGLLARLEASAAAEPEAPKLAPGASGAKPSPVESRETTQPTVPAASRADAPTSKAGPSEPSVLHDTGSPPGEAEGATESFRRDAAWFPRRRRARWTWMGAAALSAAAVLAISVTYRFRPLVDEASRRAVDRDLAAPPTPMEAAESKDAEEDAALPLPPPEPQPVPTAAPFFSDALTEQKTSEPLGPHSEIAAEGFRSMPPSPEAPALVPAQPPPASVDAEQPSGRKIVASPRSSPKLGKQEALRASSAPTTRPASPVSGAAAQAAAGARPVVVVARSNLDVTWRLTGTEIERSDDAGKTWHRQPATAQGALLAGSAPSAEICWAAGANGTVLRSSDGRHWERLTSPTSADIVQITAWSASSASIRTASGERFSTNDGGRTWSKP